MSRRKRRKRRYCQEFYEFAAQLVFQHESAGFFFRTDCNPVGIDEVDAGLTYELAHEGKQADTTSETQSQSVRKGFEGFLLLTPIY